MPRSRELVAAVGASGLIVGFLSAYADPAGAASPSEPTLLAGQGVAQAETGRGQALTGSWPAVEGRIVPSATTDDAHAFGLDDFSLFETTRLEGLLADVTNEPSVATDGRVVLFTYNHYAAISADRGSTFSLLSPWSLPVADGYRFCCDQRALYVASHRLFIWVLLYVDQYQDPAFVRVAAAAPADALLNSWTWWDFFPENIKGARSTDSLDFPNIAATSKYAYFTATIFRAGATRSYGSAILRLDLGDMRSGGSLSYTTYHLPDANAIAPVHGATGTMYFGAHYSPAYMTVYKWPESGVLGTRQVRHSVYVSASGSSCRGPDRKDMCQGSDSRIQTGWVADGTVGFLWNAGADRSEGFPYPYVFVTRLDASTLRLRDEPLIWSDEVAYAYAWLSPNSRGDLGGVVSYAGPRHFPSAALIIKDEGSGDGWDLVAARSGTAGPSTGARWGDYMTSHIAGSRSATWVAGVFTIQSGRVEPLFVWFGREADRPFGTPAPAVPTPTPRPTPLPGRTARPTRSPSPSSSPTSAPARGVYGTVRDRDGDVIAEVCVKVALSRTQDLTKLDCRVYTDAGGTYSVDLSSLARGKKRWIYFVKDGWSTRAYGVTLTRFAKIDVVLSPSAQRAAPLFPQTRVGGLDPEVLTGSSRP